MNRYLISSVGFVVVMAIVVTAGRYNDASAHCQVPRGIYDDSARIAAMLEDQTTIAKAMRQIGELSSGGSAKDHNQLARWVTTKE